MPLQKVKFVTGFGSFGGSTVALLEHCRLLRENGFDARLYAPGDWHMGRFDGSAQMSDFSPEKEDIVVFHHVDLKVRPKCRRSLLYLHEKSLWPLEGRNLLPFDSVVYVCESQKRHHGVPGFVVPNPVSRMVDPGLHRPPGGNVAGVVGTIQSRKRQHISIERALADGRSRVLLFGDFEEGYFNSHIKPLLSDRVVHMGLVDPDDRMSMYNSFDHLYMFSSDESASLVLGECRLLGKSVFKSDEVSDYEMPADEEIVERWKVVFEDSSPVIAGSRMILSSEPMERLVCVVTHDRKELVARWLRAWNNCDRHGAKICVLHACDSESPNRTQMDNILAYRPDFYIPFRNGALKDMRALHLVLRDAAGLPDWENIFWFTDDLVPMRSDFLTPFVEKLKDDVGLVAQCYEPRHGLYEGRPGEGCLPHIRTVAYALSRRAADVLVFPSVGSESERPYLFEHGRVGLYEDHILKQVEDAGLGFALCHSDPGRYVHWTQTLDWMWDCHLFSDGADVGAKRLSPHQMWELYERQFAAPGSLDPLLIFTPERCERIALRKGKISAIIPTFSSPMNCFMWSVFSLLLRSDPSVLEHLFVSINGPDSREGGNELQDRKQKFVEELRSSEWSGRGLDPGAITLTRTWSRIGHAQALEQSIPWVDTEFYLSMHDDVIVTDSSWCDISDFRENGRLALKTWGPHLVGKIRTTGDRLDLPHLNTIFTLCNKPVLTSLGSRWIGFHLDERFSVGDYMDADSFLEEHRRFGSASRGVILDREFRSASLDIGAFLFSKIYRGGLETGRFAPDTVRHFESASWKPDKAIRIPEVDILEDEIMSFAPYAEIYARYAEIG